MRVAWVDDEAVIRVLARRIVERAGSTCVGFEDHAALLGSSEGPFDAAVLQPTDTVPAVHALAVLRGRGVATVVLASGDSAMAWMQAGIDVGAFDGFLEKPFTAQDLRDALGLDEQRGEVAS